MRVEQRDGKVARKIVIGMIINKEVVGRIANKWPKDGLFRNKWSNIVGGWCVRYFKKYGEAPGRRIESVFDSWADKADKDTAQLVERFLDSLSGEYESLTADVNARHLLDLAEEHFNEVRSVTLAKEIEDAVERGKLGDAIGKIHSFSKVELGESETIDVLLDKKSIQEAFAEKQEQLFSFPGCVGSFLGSVFERDAFVSFVAADKAGKSFWLNECGWQAMLNRKRVAHFVVGDMSKTQVLRRYAARAARRPLKKTTKEKPVRYPETISHTSGDKYAQVEAVERHFKSDMIWQDAWKAFEQVSISKVKSKKPYLKLSCHSASTISILGIVNKLQQWEREEWVPDIVIIDYADNLSAIDGREETRHQINRTWQEMSNLRSSLHCCLITATQANAKAYTSYILGPQNFSENKMKNAHVSAMIGINQMSEEKEMDVTRLNIVRLRSDEYSVSRCVHVAGCRPIGNICVKSCF